MQALGMQELLRRWGHDPAFVHIYSRQLENANRKRKPVNSLRTAAYAAGYSLMRSSLERRFASFNSFFDRHFKVTRRYENFEEAKEDPPEFDAYICGSDQIWRFDTGMAPGFFLRFADSAIPAIAYAPSFGHVATESQPPPELAGWIDRFQHLSAREESGRELIKGLIGRDAPLVLDPAFFLTAAEWREYAAPARKVKGDYILFYALEFNPLVSKAIHRLAKSTGLRVVVIGKAGGIVLNPKTCLALDAGPDEFLSLLEGAALVVTNSFHATVFSLIFDRPFVSVRHSARNERIEHLLQIAHVPDRLVSSEGDIDRLVESDVLRSPGEALAGPLAGPLESSRSFLRSAVSDIESNLVTG